jgi:hypothetical protein
MKKFFLTFMLLVSFSAICFASQESYESTNDPANAASATSSLNNTMITFVNYTLPSGSHEYWVRSILEKTDDNKIHKLQYYASIIVDNIAYPLQPVYNVASKYMYTATKNLNSDYAAGIANAQSTRYYIIPVNVMTKIVSSNNPIAFSFSQMGFPNATISFDDDFSHKIRHIFALQYTDISTLMHSTSNQSTLINASGDDQKSSDISLNQ